MARLKDLSPVKKQMFYTLRDGMKRLLSDDCTDEEVAYMINKTNAESKGYYKQDSFVSYDEAMRILGIRNRVTLKNYLDRHRIKIRTINNRKIGFLRSEIESLASEIK